MGSPRRAQSPPMVGIEAIAEGLKGMCPVMGMMDTLPEEEVEGKARQCEEQHASAAKSAQQGGVVLVGGDGKAKDPVAVGGVQKVVDIIVRDDVSVARQEQQQQQVHNVGEKKMSLESDISSVADIADASHQSYDVDPWKSTEGGVEGARKISSTSVSSAEEDHEHTRRSRSGSVHDRVQFFDSLGRIRRSGVVSNMLQGKTPLTTGISGAMTYEDAYTVASLPAVLVTDKSSTLPRMKSVHIEPERPNRKSLDSQGSSGSGDPE